MPLTHLHPETLLQLGDASEHGGVVYHEALGGAAEVELLGDRDESAQVAHLDAVGRLEGNHVGRRVHRLQYGALPGAR